MTEQKRLWLQKELLAQKERQERVESGSLPLNCAPDFWAIYGQRPGMLRRRALVALFQRFPLSKLPVNNHWQANTVDPDLRYLMKRGVLVQVRFGGARSLHPLNKSSRKRQSYLVLSQAAQAMALK